MSEPLPATRPYHYDDPQLSGTIDRVTESNWQGMRHHVIANVRSLYYEDGQAHVVWEVDTWGRLDDFAHARPWRLFETFLLGNLPTATRIFANDAEPAEETERNREFLASLDYEHVAGTYRIIAKEVVRP